MADLNLASVALIWGINMPIMKFALGRMDDEYLFNAVRLTFSAITLGALLAWKYRKKTTSINGAEADAADGTRPTGEDAGPPRRLRIPIWRRYSRRQWVSILSFSFLAGFAYQVCFLLGIDGTTAGNTALIMSAIPMWTAILAFLMIGERLKRGAWAGLWIALAGVLIVTFSKSSSNIVIQGSLVGNLIVSLAAFSWAFASVLSRPLMKTVSPLELAFYSVALTVPFHFLIAGPAVAEIGQLFDDPWLMLAIVYSGVFSTGLAYAMWNFGVQQLGASHAAGFQNLVPLVALAASWLLIGEVPFPAQVIGGVVIISGLWTMRNQRQKTS